MKRILVLMTICLVLITGCGEKKENTQGNNLTTSKIVESSTTTQSTTIEVTSTTNPVDIVTTTVVTTSTSTKTTTEKTTKKTTTTNKVSSNTTTEKMSKCEVKSNYSNIPVYMKANCVEANSSADKDNQTKMKSEEITSKILDGKGYTELTKCNTYFKDTTGKSGNCMDRVETPVILFSTDYRIYGYAVKFKMYYAEDGSTTYNKLAAEGYVKADGTIVYTTKTIPY